MANFDFLKEIVEYKVFADAAIEAERVFHSSPSMCAIGCRKALELAVKWVYTADTSMILPYKDNLQSLLHAKSFKDELPETLWRELQPIVKMGNLAVHSDTYQEQQLFHYKHYSILLNGLIIVMVITMSSVHLMRMQFLRL